VARNAAAASRARIRWRDIVPGFDGQRPDADSESFVLCCLPSHHAARMNRGPGGSAFSRISSVWKRLRVNRHLRPPMDCRPPGRWPAGWPPRAARQRVQTIRWMPWKHVPDGVDVKPLSFRGRRYFRGELGCAPAASAAIGHRVRAHPVRMMSFPKGRSNLCHGCGTRTQSTVKGV